MGIICSGSDHRETYLGKQDPDFRINVSEKWGFRETNYSLRDYILKKAFKAKPDYEKLVYAEPLVHWQERSIGKLLTDIKEYYSRPKMLFGALNGTPGYIEWV